MFMYVYVFMYVFKIITYCDKQGVDEVFQSTINCYKIYGDFN